MKRVTLAITYISIYATAIADIRLLSVCLFVYYVCMSFYYVLLAHLRRMPIEGFIV